jgi:dipeptidyl-peptidase-4
MDNNVHVQNTIVMAERLIEAGKDFRLMLYPRERHGFRQQHHRVYNNGLVIRFLMEHLLGRVPAEEPAPAEEEKPAA